MYVAYTPRLAQTNGPLESNIQINLAQCSGSKAFFNVKMLKKANQSVEGRFTVQRAEARCKQLNMM